MNTESLKENLFSVVRLDGSEQADINFETIKEWYFKRQINESSLIFSAQIGQWQMLKKVFDIEELKAELFGENRTTSYSAEPSFDSPVQSAAPPENFSPTDKGNINYGGYTNNTHLPPPRPATMGFDRIFPEKHAGFRVACIFLVTNLIIWVISSLILVALPTDAADTSRAFKFGQTIGKDLLKFLVDLYLINRLWNAADNDNSARIWTIVRTYIGSVIYLPFVFAYFSAGFYFAGLTAVGAIVFYAFGLLVVLHGKESPAPSRIKIGWAAFALFILFSILSMFSSAAVISDSGKNTQAFNDFKKYELPSNVFSDPQLPVKITLPVGWKQYSPQNPHITDPNARMIAMDSTGNRGAKFTVYPYPKKVDISNAQLPTALDESIRLAEPKLKAEDPSYQTILASTTYLGNKTAKRIIFERNSKKGGGKVKGHTIFTMDDSNAYVLEMWCGADEYQSAGNDFAQFEANFSFQ